MFGLGFGEIVVILLVALLVLGPTKLPKLARQLGRGMREFRRAASEFQATLSEADLERPSPKPKIPKAAPTDTVSSSNSIKTIAEPPASPSTSEEEPASKPETEG